jgi:hypothetical protein
MILVLKNGIQVPIIDFFSLLKKEKKINHLGATIWFLKSRTNYPEFIMINDSLLAEPKPVLREKNHKGRFIKKNMYAWGWSPEKPSLMINYDYLWNMYSQNSWTKTSFQRKIIKTASN